MEMKHVSHGNPPVPLELKTLQACRFESC